MTATSKLLPSLSKSKLFCSKLFQRFLWRFCGISTGCKASKPKRSFTKFLIADAAPLAERSQLSQNVSFSEHRPEEPARSATALPRRSESSPCVAEYAFSFEGVGLAAIRRRHRGRAGSRTARPPGIVGTIRTG